MEFGLTSEQATLLKDSFNKYFTQGALIVHGSRAKGNFNPRSDIDLVIKSAGTNDRHLLANLHDEIDESDFPYLCDIKYLEEIKNPYPLDRIKRVGKILFERVLFERGLREAHPSNPSRSLSLPKGNVEASNE